MTALPDAAERHALRERFAQQLVNNCGFPTPDDFSAAVACDKAAPLQGDQEDIDFMVGMVKKFISYGSTTVEIADWFDVALDLNATLKFAKRGYTPRQFEMIRTTYFRRYNCRLP